MNGISKVIRLIITAILSQDTGLTCTTTVIFKVGQRKGFVRLNPARDVWTLTPPFGQPVVINRRLKLMDF